MSDNKKGDNPMRHALETTGQANEGAPRGRTFAPFAAVIAATEVAFIFGLVTRLSWQECALVVLVTATLAGGLVFTVVEMQRLGGKGR
jgi:hypothetical protein